MNKRIVVWVTLWLGSLLLAAGGVFWGVGYTQVAGQGDGDTFLPLVARPHPLPIIHYFHADVPIADPGQTIELAWGTQNATQVTLFHLLPTGQLGTWWEVGPTGTMTYTISPLERNQTSFMLFAGNEGGTYVQAGLTIPLTCPDSWFFTPHPEICPAGPAIVSPGAEQPFEHGRMVWVQGEDRIYVLFADGSSPHWYPYEDLWDPGDPEIDPTIIPPPGYYQPQRGFGLVWREQPGVRARLGWATEPEMGGYMTAVQRTSYPRYNDTYIRASDGHVWRLFTELSGWEKVYVTGWID
ncbi:MAG: hypothetical protein KJ063_15860 [Anaerolineae bacterium]|nr:hypothetical protein [Anaerolineae bacterium]